MINVNRFLEMSSFSCDGSYNSSINSHDQVHNFTLMKTVKGDKNRLLRKCCITICVILNKALYFAPLLS